MNDTDMRHEIMLTVQANQLPVTGELWLALAHCDTAALRGICQELHIHQGATQVRA